MVCRVFLHKEFLDKYKKEKFFKFCIQENYIICKGVDSSNSHFFEMTLEFQISGQKFAYKLCVPHFYIDYYVIAESEKILGFGTD